MPLIMFVSSSFNTYVNLPKKKVRERKLWGPEMVQLTTDKVRVIKKRMKEAYDRQKSYADS
jgi:hypothetical protein